MKLFLYSLISIILLALVPIVLPQQLNITQEEKEEIISYLDSVDYRGAINTITEYKISEARVKIEQVFWDSKFDKIDQLNLLDLLYEFNSPSTQSYAMAFIDSLNNLPPDYSGDLPSYLKAMTAGILVQLGDNSKIDLFFNFVEEDSLNSTFSIINLLSVIMEKVPEYEERAKNELIKFVKFSEYDNARYAALMPLYRRYESEMVPLMLDVFTEDEEANNRQLVLDILIVCCNSPELHILLKERLWLDSNYYVRYKIMSKLLGVYGTPEDYKFVLDYLPNESDPKVKEFTQDNLELFEPPKPDSNLTIGNLIDNILSQTDSLYGYAWLGDLQFKDELQAVLQSAKTNLLAGDSLACATDVKSFQDSVDIVYADSLNADPRFVTMKGWKFLYWNAQYILDRLPEIPLGESISTYSVFATQSIWLKQNSDILSGSVGVNEAGEGPFLDSQLELSVGKSTTTPAGYTIKANRIKVKQSATVNSDVYYNELTNNGTITGELYTPLELPLLATLPEFKTSTPGTEDIVVPQNGEHTLLPGAYGEIQVKKNGKLIFTGGEYNIFKFNGGDNNQLIFQSSSEVRIKDKFDTGQGSYIGPEDTTTLSAKDIVFYVEGINGNNGNLGATPKAAKVGLNNTVKANFYVPNGTLWLRENSEVEGAFVGKDVIVGIRVQVKLNSAF